MNPIPSLTRRRFIGQLSVGAAALALSHRLSAVETVAPKKLGVALVGLGTYATHQLAPALTRTTLCRLAGVVTGSREKGQKWAQQYGFPEQSIYSYDTMAQMANNPDIDIVYVVTPNSLHSEHVIAAAKAGKHVISEKPFTSTVAQAEAALAACRAAGVKLSIGYRLHFDPYHQEMMRLARDPAFGGFIKGNGNFSFTMGRKVWRAEKKLAGGGPIMDLGVYLIQGACMAAGGMAPIAVTAKEGPKTRPDMFTDVEETMNFRLEFANGFTFDGGTSYQQNFNEIQADGRKGFIQIKPAFGYGGMNCITQDGPLKLTPPASHQALQMDDFAACVQAGRESKIPGEMGLRDMKVIEAIYEAAASGKRVDIKA
ncbi:MAG: Gfo/Idh/MocA family oxidoreductase [Opitutus sp.]